MVVGRPALEPTRHAINARSTQAAPAVPPAALHLGHRRAPRPVLRQSFNAAAPGVPAVAPSAEPLVGAAAGPQAAPAGLQQLSAAAAAVAGVRGGAPAAGHGAEGDLAEQQPLAEQAEHHQQEAVPKDVLREFEHKLEADLQSVAVTLTAVTGVIIFWRGVWSLLDALLGESMFGDICCIIVGLTIVLWIRLSGIKVASSFWPPS